MPRKTFDAIVSWVGVLLTVGLIAAGTLMFWGYSFANSSVGDQLVAQKISFPKAGSEALKDPRIGPYLSKYAGQQLVNGAQAQAYADHFIAVHLKDTANADGKTYAELGTVQSGLRTKIQDAKAGNDPALPDLENQLAGVTAARETVFKGETLRGLLLEAYGFWKIGQLAFIGSIVSFSLAGILAVLTILGFWHLRRVSPVEQILAPVREEIPERRLLA